MLSRAVLAAVMSLLGLVLWVGSPLRPAQGDEKGKVKSSASQTPKELEPKTFTLQAKDMPVAKALAELARQTGNTVEDRRATKDETKIKLDLKEVTFWQALDAIAKAADGRISLYERDNKLALVDGPYLALPVSYSGLFRLNVKRIDTHLMLDSDTHESVIYLEVAWEPRLQPLFMEMRPDSVTLQDDKGRAIEVPEGEKGKGAVGKRNAAEIPIRLPAPQRSANQIGLFKGKLSAIVPVKMVTFTFDQLAKIQKGQDARKETKDGVTVHLRELISEGDEDDQSWTAGLLLEYAVDSVKLESFQSSFLTKEVYLEKEKDGIVQQFPPNGGHETEGDALGEGKTFFRFHFVDQPEKKLILGKFSDWKLVYRVPGKLVEVPIPFEFKEVPLP